jgi:hypothetical protein
VLDGYLREWVKMLLPEIVAHPHIKVDFVKIMQPKGVAYLQIEEKMVAQG